MLILGVVPIVMAVAAAVAGVVSLIGMAVAAGDRAKARQLRQEAIDKYGEEVKSVLDPMVAEQIGETEFASIAEDSDILKTQKDLLGEFDAYAKGGMGPGDEAALRLADQGVSQRASSDAASLQQSLAARGQQMNPALAAAMAAQTSQTAVNAAGNNRLQALADARGRAYDALSQKGRLAGSIRDDDWRRSSARAGAQDVNNRWNANQRAFIEQQNRANLMRIAEAKLRGGNQAADNQYEQAGDTQAGFNAGAKAINQVGYSADDMAGYEAWKKNGGK